MSGVLALASAIAGMDRPALEALVRRRWVPSPSHVMDPIGLATELLRPESIARTLTGLERRALTVLLDPGGFPGAPEIGELTGLGLLGIPQPGVPERDPVPLPEVDAVLREALEAAGIEPAALQSGDPAAGDGPAVPEHEHETADGWYATALTAVAQAAECLRALAERPGRLNRTGTVAVATVRALAETTRTDAEQLARTLTALERAELTTAVREQAALLPSAAAPSWLATPHAGRWLVLAERTLAAMGPELRRTLERGRPADLGGAVAALAHAFPLLPEAELAAARSFAADAEHLGLTTRGRLSEVARSLLAGDRAEARAEVERLFPAASTGVYVQPDLSVVVPGPLAPPDEALLASLTAPEHVGVASTRRVTEATVTAALEGGLTPSEAREAFERLSMTGIPQPLDYLLRSLAERRGSIVVAEHHGDEGRTRLELARRELAETLLVDRALQHLQLQRDDGRAAEGRAGAGRAPADPGSRAVTLISRLRIEHVLAALADARYPATRLRMSEAGAAGGAVADARTSPLPGRERDPDPAVSAPRTAAAEPAHSASPELPEPLAALVERVFTAARSEPGAGDFTRRLELAIRDRSPVRVTAEARGESRTFVLVPISVTAGRLRAGDQAAGVERTLPISVITAVDPA